MYVKSLLHFSVAIVCYNLDFPQAQKNLVKLNCITVWWVLFFFFLLSPSLIRELKNFQAVCNFSQMQLVVARSIFLAIRVFGY